MYKVTVIKNGIVKAVQFNASEEKALSNAKMLYNNAHVFIVECTK